MARVVVTKLAVGGDSATADPPTLQTIRLAYGVGSGREATPSTADFRTTYQVTIPVFSLGGLDPDGVYEFDASMLLGQLTDRAQRRRWGVRLELELIQSAGSAGAADVVVEGPDGAGELSIVGPAQGESLPGGGRRLLVATAVVTDPAAVTQLDGTYRIGIGDATPRPVNVAFGRFEFEG